jgi:hypothetical protein
LFVLLIVFEIKVNRPKLRTKANIFDKKRVKVVLHGFQSKSVFVLIAYGSFRVALHWRAQSTAFASTRIKLPD